MAAPTPSEVRDAQAYLTTRGLTKISAHRLGSASKELNKSLDETIALIRSLAEGETNQPEQMKRRVEQATRTEK